MHSLGSVSDTFSYPENVTSESGTNVFKNKLLRDSPETEGRLHPKSEHGNGRRPVLHGSS
jgi:hypothetical protein